MHTVNLGSSGLPVTCTSFSDKSVLNALHARVHWKKSVGLGVSNAACLNYYTQVPHSNPKQAQSRPGRCISSPLYPMGQVLKKKFFFKVVVNFSLLTFSFNKHMVLICLTQSLILSSLKIR